MLFLHEVHEVVGSREAAFEDASGSDLGWFFSQWVDRRGYPRFTINNPVALLLGGRHMVAFTLEQKGKQYRYSLPVKVLSEEGAAERVALIEGKKTYVEIESPGRPLELVVDGGYDLMRGLSGRESPPRVSALHSTGYTSTR